MGKQARKQPKATKAFQAERLFMANGSILTPRYLEKRTVQGQAPGSPVMTQYLGSNGLFLGEVNEAHVALRANMSVPMQVVKVPSGPQPGAPLVDAQTFPAGTIEVANYRF